MKKLTILAILLLTAACTKPSDAEKALEDLGMTNIRTGGYAWFACSQDDFYHTSFTATNAQGRQITGTVCSGVLFKNSTVRFN
jgi:hypothetical protein